MIANIKCTLVFILIIIASCNKKKDLSVPQASTIDYYPLQIGSFFVYDVVQSKYDLLGKYDTTYQIKVVLQDSWIDLESNTSYKMFRYKKPQGTNDFVLDSLWHVKKVDSKNVVVTENNVPYLKLSMPLAKDKTWSGNLYNSYPEQLYKVSSIGSAWGRYPNTATIIEKNASNLLFRDYSAEVYAENIGLVYKEIQNVKFEFGKGTINEGIVYKQTLSSYGLE